MTAHPNTIAALIATAISGVILKIALHFGLDLSPADALVYAGAVISAVLFVGKRGLKGTWKAIWGTGDPSPTPPAPVKTAGINTTPVKPAGKAKP